MESVTPNMPTRQYAISSTRVVSLLDAQTIFCLMLSVPGLNESSAGMGIAVISDMSFHKATSKSEILSLGASVILFQDFPKNWIFVGAKSSCRVQPLVNHGSLRMVTMS